MKCIVLGWESHLWDKILRMVIKVRGWYNLKIETVTRSPLSIIYWRGWYMMLLIYIMVCWSQLRLMDVILRA